MNRIYALAFAAALAGACAVADAAPAAADTLPNPPRSCITPGAWTVLDGTRSDAPRAEALIAQAAKQQVVVLGEEHDEVDHHRWQLQVLAALHAQRPDMVIGFEMFPRRVQPALDRWVTGQLTVQQFLAQSEWNDVWGYPAELYLPLFQFARINRIPMVALNVDSKLTKAIDAKGFDAIPEREREGVGRPAAPSKAYRETLFDIYRQHGSGAQETHASKPEATDRAFDYFVEAQTTWDRAMAEALARYVTAGSAARKPLAVGVMGNGHVRFGEGVPHQLRALGVKSIGTLMPVPFDVDCKELRPGLADAVFAIPQVATAKAEPPRLGVGLQEKDGAVVIASVSGGSLAEKSGLKTGDRLVEVAGVPVKAMPAVIAAVRQQPGGTWLPMRIKRAAETLDVVVKFPPQP